MASGTRFLRNAPAAPGGVARIEVFTIFPDMVEAYLGTSLLGRARRAGVLAIGVRDLRDGATDVHRSVDDAPFGGGAGMVLAPEPVFAAVEAQVPPRPLILLGPAGRRFDQDRARELAAVAMDTGFSLLCGRYEGVDHRIVEHLVDEELSIGDYVLAGGEAAALVVIEATARLVPGVLGNAESNRYESFADGLLEEPQYTRPAEFRGWAVPDVLRSGDHARIARWRLAASLHRTRERRPDLFGGRELTEEERAALEEFPRS
ncbi:MAG: tRNA (guanosine(37)-N1)-methyltransferase TrmD [Acidimicrobiales bacterium]